MQRKCDTARHVYQNKQKSVDVYLFTTSANLPIFLCFRVGESCLITVPYENNYD